MVSSAASKGKKVRKAGTKAKSASATGRKAAQSRSKASPKKASGKKNSAKNLEALTANYRSMLLIRRFEEKAGQLYGMGHIGGFCHLYIGQEAIVVGIQAVLREHDDVITGYRDHGHMIACGMDLGGIMAELTGRATGLSKGKGGSMHMFSREKNFFGGHGIVAAQVPLGTGLAFAQQYRQSGGCSVVYFGDGATNQGQVYESFNMASLWRLPVLYVIENNRYGMGTSVERSAAQGSALFQRGSAHGIPGLVVDGMDVEAVQQAADKALKSIRQGQGPQILEMKTYRYRGHSMSDPARYRSREEVQDVRERHDPIDHVRQVLLERGMTEDALKAIDAQIKKDVAAAAAFALDSPEPAPEELWTDVYRT